MTCLTDPLRDPDAPNFRGDANSLENLMACQTTDPAPGTLVHEFVTIMDDELETVVSQEHEAFRIDSRQRPVPHRASIVTDAARSRSAAPTGE